ncbi:class I SAM-dependent methyltransferase [Candidatus Peregrinibacteria bacterium]|nr:MAG: class I SAM-dependent methyltransferase [Candidatus Peregrinibacteria bacterium]
MNAIDKGQYVEGEVEVLESIQRLPIEDRAIIERTLRRYNAESQVDGYRADPSALVQFLVEKRLLVDSPVIFDLGAGPGDLLKRLSNEFPNANCTGIDLARGFVDKFNQQQRSNARMRMGLIDSPSVFPGDDEIEGGVVSVLTLDRLLYPRQLAANMSRFTRSRIIATLLPVVAEDDNPSRQGDEK